VIQRKIFKAFWKAEKGGFVRNENGKDRGGKSGSELGNRPIILNIMHPRNRNTRDFAWGGKGHRWWGVIEVLKGYVGKQPGSRMGCTYHQEKGRDSPFQFFGESKG